METDNVVNNHKIMNDTNLNHKHNGLKVVTH